MASAVPSARAQVDVAEALFSGYATGASVHADALNAAPTTRVANADVSFSSAAVNSAGLSPAITNEVQRVVVPAATDKKAYAMGKPIEVAIADDPATDGQIVLPAKVEQSAPPTPNPATKTQSLLAQSVDPVLAASVLEGSATARYSNEACILGQDISNGYAQVADAQLLDVDTGAGATPGLEAPIVAADINGRNVSDTRSRMKLVPQYSEPTTAAPAGTKVGDHFGLMAQTRITMAPVRLNIPPDTNPANDILIEVLGEWVLSVVATGITGTAWVHYGPGVTEPTAPIISIAGQTLTFQQVFGNAGFTLDLPSGIASIAIGEDPRAIGGNAASQPAIAADGTSVSAAVDIVRIQLVEPQLADVRVGHMEAKAAVPAGGVRCSIPVTKDADPREVTAPGTFLYNIEVFNTTSACPLENVVLTDTIRTKSGNPVYAFAPDDPRNNPPNPVISGGGKVATVNLGTIPAGQTRKVVLVVSATGGSGVLENTANVTGDLACPANPATGEAAVRVPLAGGVVVERPRVDGSKVLPRTGGPAALAPVAIALLTLGGSMWHLRRRSMGNAVR